MFQVKQEVPDDWLADAPMPPDEQNYGGMVYAYQQQGIIQRPQPIHPQQQMCRYEGYQVPYGQQYMPGPSVYYPNEGTSTSTSTQPQQQQQEPQGNEHDLVEIGQDFKTPYEKWMPSGEPTVAYPKYWASVYYYETDKRVGCVFNTMENMFVIDGATCKWEDNRMSIASTPLSASKKASEVRNQFGAGIRIRRENGKVKLSCLTQSPIFVQCPQRALMHGEVLNMVYRLQTVKELSEMTIFDEEYFDKLIQQRKHLINDDFYMLHNHCITRISFIKGFGSDYPRTVITETPCWVEVHMNHKLHEFDRVLKHAISELNETMEEE